MKFGSKRRLKPIISGAFSARTTSRQRRTRSTERSIGFSQKIALPALAACSIMSACRSVGVVISTASMSLAAMIASTLRTSAPCAFGDGLGRLGKSVGHGYELRRRRWRRRRPREPCRCGRRPEVQTSAPWSRLHPSARRAVTAERRRATHDLEF